MGWWPITQDMYMGDEVADLLEDFSDLSEIASSVLDTLNGMYQREFGRGIFQEELKAALNFVQIDLNNSNYTIDWDQFPARGVVPEYGSGLGFAMRNLPGIVNDT